MVGTVAHFVSQLLNVRVVEESHFVSLANQSHHISSSDIEVRESEACLLLTSLHFQYSRRQPSQSPYYAFGFVAQKGQRASGLESGGEQLNEEKEELEGVSNVEEEIVSLMESVVEFGLENGDELTHLREGEVLPKVTDEVEQDLGCLWGALKLREKSPVEPNAGRLAGRRSKPLEELKEVENEAISVVEDGHSDGVKSGLLALLEKE